MRFLLAVVALLFALGLVGCGEWQANRSSQAVDFDLGQTPAVTPANGAGYVDGGALDMRSRH
jgi:hypothetical protein